MLWKTEITAYLQMIKSFSCQRELISRFRYKQALGMFFSNFKYDKVHNI